ncbi:hypothetical protein ACYOEI_00215 [Singulisphaera rosea]
MIDELLAKARKKGTDKKFLDWIRCQPSCLSGRFSEWVDGEGRSIPAHVRRAKEAGTAFKPEYSAVPLHFDEHNEQSWYGESACLNKFKPKGSGFWTNLDAKEWFDRKRIEYLKGWLES